MGGQEKRGIEEGGKDKAVRDKTRGMVNMCLVVSTRKMTEPWC